MKKYLSVLILIIIICSLSDPLAAKKSKRKKDIKKESGDINVRIDQPITKKFPEMDVFVSVNDNNHEPILSLYAGIFLP